MRENGKIFQQAYKLNVIASLNHILTECENISKISICDDYNDCGRAKK